MHLRRALLLFAVVLGVSAMAAAIGSAPRDREEKPTTTAEASPPPSETSDAQPLTFDARPGKPVKRTVKIDSHVILTVPVAESGEVRIDSLGLVASAEPGTPATFDIYADRRGSFDISFEPPTGSNEPVGALVVR
ncbi:MAG: hypothetical protein H0T15_01240 [Thermoleophilaceae bacterium]|nr:hypothetical protein [Thermoleophilaceae bacterium]